MHGAETAFEHCADLVRAHDKDRFLAGLFAPEPARRHLYALYAFNVEVSRVRDLVSNPLPGEIRLQWWRDALVDRERGDVQAHPVASALLDTVGRFGLPVQALLNLLDARIFDLYDDPMPSLGDLEGYAGETASALIQVAALVLMDGADPGTHDLAGHAGVAQAITGLLRALPLHAARGQVYLPKDVLERHGASVEDIVARRATPGVLAALEELRETARRHLAEVRAGIGAVPPAAMPAFLPVALVEPYLARLSRPGHDPFKQIADIAAWRRPLILWRAARRARR